MRLTRPSLYTSVPVTNESQDLPGSAELSNISIHFKKTNVDHPPPWGGGRAVDPLGIRYILIETDRMGNFERL